MNTTIFQIPFVQIALPIVFSVLIAAWINGKAFDTINKRLNDMRSDFNRRFESLEGGVNKRLDEVNTRLGRIETKLGDHDVRIARVEDRLPAPLVRG